MNVNVIRIRMEYFGELAMKMLDNAISERDKSTLDTYDIWISHILYEVFG